MSGQSWNIATATVEATEAIARLHADSFKVAYLRNDGSERDKSVLAEVADFLTPERLEKRRELIESTLNDPENEFYQIAHSDTGDPIGLIYGFKENQKYELSALYVHKDYFGKGVGEALIKAFREWADPALKIELGVVEDNERAKKFYSKMGFQALGDQRNSWYPFLPETSMVINGEQEKSMENEPLFKVTEMLPEEIEEATNMRLESWLDTYINDDLGVSREWIESRNEEQRIKDRQKSREERFEKGRQNGTFNAWVAKDVTGKIVGSTTPFIDSEGIQRVGSIYVDKDWHGKGVGKELMQQVIDWFDPSKPIELMVVTYNDRAKAFYRKWKFEEVPGSEDLFDGKIPEIKMIRKANNEI